jgi:hypothetical protein
VPDQLQSSGGDDISSSLFLDEGTGSGVIRAPEAPDPVTGTGRQQQIPPPTDTMSALWSPSIPGDDRPQPQPQPGGKPSHLKARTPKKATGQKTPKRLDLGLKGRKGASGTGVVLDGKVAHRAVVNSGKVVSYRRYESDSPVEALKAALDGARGASVVVVLGGLLFKPSVEAAKARKQRQAMALVSTGTSAWPAANLAAVAAMPVLDGKVALAGLEGPVPDGFWDVIGRAGATVVPLPFVLCPDDGAWLVVGDGASWLVTVSNGTPEAYRELRSGAAQLPQVATMAGVELSRLTKAGSHGHEIPVYVTGVPDGSQTTDALSRAGLRVVSTPFDGVVRWEIPVVEQGLAALAVRAATARLKAPESSYTSPEAIKRQAEAPEKRKRVVVTGAVTAAFFAIAATGVVPAVRAKQALGQAKSSLSIAAEDSASVARWLGLSQQAATAKRVVSEIKSANPEYAQALGILSATSPPGTKMASIVATPPSTPSGQVVPGAAVEMTVQASIAGASFGPVAAWQRRLEAIGASVQVSSESVFHGQVNVTMTVGITPKGRKN